MKFFSEHLREVFGEKVWRVSVDPGFSCPNRGSDRSKGGCIYCNNRAFTPSYLDLTGRVPISEQIKRGIELISKKKRAKKFLAYFQPYTATYGKPERLRDLIYECLKVPHVVGIILGTRPDCLDGETLKLLHEVNEKTYLWVELGLQSAHDETLRLIKRGHTAQDFERAVKELTSSGIKTAAHVILGLPGEGLSHWLKTAEFLRKCNVNGIKIHNIHVLKNTELEKWYLEGKFSPISMEEYIEGAVQFLRRLPDDVIIMRLASSVPERYLVAPEWAKNYPHIISEIKRRLSKA